jgi:hypothetical protein
LDQHLELGGEVQAARVVEKIGGDLRAIPVEHAHEALLGHERAHHVFEDVREPDALDGGVHQYRPVVGAFDDDVRQRLLEADVDSDVGVL